MIMLFILLLLMWGYVSKNPYIDDKYENGFKAISVLLFIGMFIMG